MIETIHCGTRVRWTSGAAGKIGEKVGAVERVLQPGETPSRSEIREPGASRDHVSYLVRADNGRLYWPRVRHLVPEGGPPDDRDAMLAALKEALEYATYPLPPEYATTEDQDEREAKINALWVRWFGKAPA
jgi:hypothetical protein